MMPPAQKTQPGPRIAVSARADAATSGMSHALPGWVRQELVGDGPSAATIAIVHDEGATVTRELGVDLALSSVVIPGAGELSSERLREEVRRGYRAILRSIESIEPRQLIRIWNFIPRIYREHGNGLDTYRIFNQGRYEAFCALLGGEAAFARLLPTATGIGHGSNDLLIHVLSCRTPGKHVENARQTPAYRYSQRFGPRPPCFARATVAGLGGRRRLLVGGTSSVRGEVSIHADDLRGQLGETFDNLGAVVAGAIGAEGDGGGASTDELLARFTSVRAYYRHERDCEAIAADVRRRLPRALDVEIVRADICRDELLVEVEGVADL